MYIVQKILDDFGLTSVIACEIEFTLHGSAGRDLLPFWQEVRERCERSNIGIFKIEKERGHEQHEVALLPADAEKAAQDVTRLKNILSKVAILHELKADFAAKPFADQPGNGLHVHVHLADHSGKNVFYKDDHTISDALKYAIGGLLAWLPASMAVFAPTPESYLRFTHAGDHTPTTVSWGANNRTVAVRLPDALPAQKHIEHRVAGADADPAKVIDAIVGAIHWGLVNKADPGTQIYGDAKLEMYRLPKLPITLEEAEAIASGPKKALSQN